MNNIWDRLIDALDDDDEFDMQDMLKLSGFEEDSGDKGGGEAKRKGGKGSKANLRNPPATKRLQTPEPTTENLLTSFFPRRSRRTSRDGHRPQWRGREYSDQCSRPMDLNPSSSAMALR